MVLCASFFSEIMAVLNQVRQDDDIRARDKRMADGGIRKKATQRGMNLTAGWPYDYSFMKLRVILRITGAVRAKGRSQSLQD